MSSNFPAEDKSVFFKLKDSYWRLIYSYKQVALIWIGLHERIYDDKSVSHLQIKQNGFISIDSAPPGLLLQLIPGAGHNSNTDNVKNYDSCNGRLHGGVL